jgi:hypothetical protein
MKALRKDHRLGRVFVAGEYWRAMDGEILGMRLRKKGLVSYLRVEMISPLSPAEAFKLMISKHNTAWCIQQALYYLLVTMICRRHLRLLTLPHFERG